MCLPVRMNEGSFTEEVVFKPNFDTYLERERQGWRKYILCRMNNKKRKGVEK